MISNKGSHAKAWALTFVWAALIGFSLLNFYLAENWLNGTQLMRVVLAASFVKLLLVAGSFMELWPEGRGFFYLATALFASTLGLIAFAW